MVIGNASDQMDGSGISDGSDFLQPIGCLGFWYFHVGDFLARQNSLSW